jgi:uncharacterized protein
MSLRDNVQDAQKQAMKDRDEKRLSTLRLLWSEIQNLEIEQKKELSDEEVQNVVARQVKQLKDSLKDFDAGGRDDLASGVKKEIELLEVYLPEQLGEEELKTIVQKVLTDNDITEVKDLGKAMGIIMKEVKGKTDGNMVRSVASELLK